VAVQLRLGGVEDEKYTLHMEEHFVKNKIARVTLKLEKRRYEDSVDWITCQ